MKVFLFSDLHCSYKYLNNIHNYLNNHTEYDAVIFSGDFLNMGEPLGFANKFLDLINRLGKPFFWVPGNNDFGSGYYKIKSKYQSLEGRVAWLGEVALTGVGGSPASWSGQYAGERMIDKKSIGGSIFVSHFPPPVILNWSMDDYTLSPSPFRKSDNRLQVNRDAESVPDGMGRVPSLSNKHTPLSSKRLADSPVIHICGHIHHQVGVSYLGQTKVIKLGAAELGHYAILDTDSLGVAFGKFN